MANVSKAQQQNPDAVDNSTHNAKDLSLAELECMNLSSKELSTISPDVFNLQFLTNLNLSNNVLTKVPEEISNLANLLHLNVSSNKLTSLPKSLRNVTRLKCLNISNNSFYEVPEVLFIGLRSLRTIDMSDNLLLEFNTMPACSVTLIELNLRKNELVQFPGWIFSNESCLESVDLSENPIEVPTTITLANVCSKGSFETIKEIKMQNTNLYPTRMEFLSSLKNVEIIHLGNISSERNKNFLEGFKSSFLKNSAQLKHLYLDYGNIAGLPSDFGALTMVQVLNLSNNSLSWLPDTFPELNSLKICDLSSNTLFFLPGKMEDLKNLKELYLGCNRLCDLPNSFMDLVHLEILDLYDNQIESLDCDIFNKLVNLKGLDIDQNFIEDGLFESDEFKCKYETLKDDIRKLTNNENRLHGQKVQQIDTTDQDVDSYRSYSSVENDDLDYQSEIVAENWDDPGEDDGVVNNFTEDDFFDPNDVPDRTHQLVFKRQKEKEIFRENFCPADNHVQPIIPISHKMKNRQDYGFEAGQFDD